MCDEYDDERMVAFWRRLEELERHARLSSESEEATEPLVHIESEIPQTPKAKPRALTH